MNVKFHIPCNRLKDLIEYIVYMSGYESGNGIAFQRTHQVIIINQNKGRTAMYAIGLKLGMLPLITGLPAAETNELAVGADHWAPRDIYYLREQLLGCESTDTGFSLIEAYLISLLGRMDLSDLGKVKWLGSAVPASKVEAICDSLGVTRKKLRREGQYYFGGSVKQIQGILRFNETLTAIAHAHEDDRRLSALHDYYDQAHFIRDFKARSGITPLQYKKLCQQFPAIRQTPNFLPLERETFLQFIS